MTNEAIEAAARAICRVNTCGHEWDVDLYMEDARALCDMIEKYEQPPVDRKLLCAREAMVGCLVPASIETVESTIVRAIELWESGYGA